MSDRILTPEQVIPFLRHDDWIVREHAKRYFHNCYQLGPLTADYYLAVIDRLGEVEESLGFAAAVKDFPQTNASLSRLLAALARKPSELFESHYQHAVRDVDMEVLSRNREQVLACPDLYPHVREHLELRLKLLDQSPAEAWQQLMRHGQELEGSYAFSFNNPFST